MCFEWEPDKDGVVVAIEQDESSRGTRAASAFISRAELAEMLRDAGAPPVHPLVFGVGDDRQTFIKRRDLARVLGVRDVRMGRWGVFIRGRTKDAAIACCGTAMYAKEVYLGGGEAGEQTRHVCYTCGRYLIEGMLDDDELAQEKDGTLDVIQRSMAG